MDGEGSKRGGVGSNVERRNPKQVRVVGIPPPVYKKYDRRGKIIKKDADDEFEDTRTNTMLEIASELEKIELEDDYFISKKLYPNVDFYSGIIYQAMGFPVEIFPVLFAIGRMPGWLAQWEEGLLDKEQKIARPRQIYVGSDERQLNGPASG